jgi:hypothetical protein
MPFIALEDSTPADAADVNNNNYFLAQGSILPVDGNNLDYTNSAVDLGSSTATWKKLYIENIYDNEITGKFGYLIGETKLSAAAASIEFTGLTGDNENYRLICFVPDCGANVQLVLNGDSGAAYSGLMIRGQSTAVGGSLTTTTYFYLAAATGGAAFIDARIFDNADYGKMVAVKSMTDCVNTTVYSICDAQYCLLNANTLTSIKIKPSAGNFAINTHIMLWRG